MYVKFTWKHQFSCLYHYMKKNTAKKVARIKIIYCVWRAMREKNFTRKLADKAVS